METSDICVEITRSYPIGNPAPLLTTQQQVNHRNTTGLTEPWGMGQSLDDMVMYWATCPSRILRRISIQGSSLVDIMKLAGIEAPLDEQYEYDITIPLPNPNRRYKVKLNIKNIKRGKPTIVDPDWI